MSILIAVCVILFVIVLWLTTKNSEKSVEINKLNYDNRRLDAKIDELYSMIVFLGYGKYEYEHRPDNTKPKITLFKIGDYIEEGTPCTTERTFVWLSDNEVIKNILERRKRESEKENKE